MNDIDKELKERLFLAFLIRLHPEELVNEQSDDITIKFDLELASETITKIDYNFTDLTDWERDIESDYIIENLDDKYFENGEEDEIRQVEISLPIQSLYLRRGKI